MATDSESLSITWRGLLIAIVTVVAWFCYHAFVLGSSGATGVFVLSQYPMMAMMPFVLWLFLNVVLKRVCPWASLSRGELLTMFSVTWLVGVLPSWGWSDYWIAILGAPIFNATPENNWETLILPFIPWNAFPESSSRVLETFWLGLPRGQALPWDAWIGTMAQWIGASTAMVVFGLCLIIVFQRQWVEREKLTFPLAQMPLDLTRGFDGPGGMPEVFRSRVFWAGFMVVFLPLLYNIMTFFNIGLPQIELYLTPFQLQLPQPFPALTFRVLPLVLALTYLCPLDILGSLILFYLLAVVKIGIMDRVGVTVGSGIQRMGSQGILDVESFGAIVFIAIWSVWLARQHLREVWDQIVRGSADDSSTVLIYRLAAAGMVVSAAYVIHFGVTIGCSLPVAAATFVLMAMTFFVTVKLIAATGFTYLMPSWPNAKGAMFMTDLIGSSNLSTQNVVSFKIFTSNAFFGNMRLPAWPAIPHHLRIFSLRKQPFLVVAVVLISFPLGCLVASWASIETAYDVGGAVHLPYAFNVYPQMANLLNHPRLLEVSKWVVWGFGLGETAVLAFLRFRFHWWPVNPIGLAFQYATGPQSYWFSLLIVWVSKFTLLHYGGVKAFQKGKHFFYGIGIGYVVGVILSGTVDVLWFPIQGHMVHYK